MSEVQNDFDVAEKPDEGSDSGDYVAICTQK